MKIKGTVYITLSFLLSILFFSCDRNQLFEQNVSMPSEGWDVKNKIKLEVTVTDSIHPTNFYVNVRNADGYPYSNIYLFVKTIFPTGEQSNDTLECVLADENGKWLGRGVGDIYDNQIPFKRNVIFPKTGKYIFEIEQGMRTDVLPLIMDVGLRIEKAN